MTRNKEALHDVRRKVAEVMKKEGEKLVFGWRGEPAPERKEGEVWADYDGRQWTIKNGIRQNITKLDAAKTPWWCPTCSKPMNHRFDIKFWRIRGHCMDCQIKLETEIRRQGKWEEYEQNVMLRNYIAEVRDKILELQAFHDEVNKPEFLLMNEHENTVQMMETWDVDLEKLKSDIRTDIETLQGYLQETIEKYGTGEEYEQQITKVSETD
jgi:hypothetical protein